MRAVFGSMSIVVEEGWADTTHDVPGEGTAPWTLARQSKDACGALQFSVATYKSGKLPGGTADHLVRMLLDFAKRHELGQAADIVKERAPLPLAAATFHKGGDVIRVWYVSDGASFAKVTYLASARHDYATELSDCEKMVRSIAFKYGRPN